MNSGHVSAFELIAMLAAVSGLIMVAGGIWLLAKGVITLAATPKGQAISVEWKKQFRLSSQVPGLAFFLVGLLFVALPLKFLQPSDTAPVEFEGDFKGVDAPVTINVRPQDWTLSASSAGHVQGKIYPDVSVLVLSVTAPGYVPFTTVVKLENSGRRLARLGTLELRRTVRESDLVKSIGDAPLTTPSGPLAVGGYGSPQ